MGKAPIRRKECGRGRIVAEVRGRPTVEERCSWYADTAFLSAAARTSRFAAPPHQSPSTAVPLGFGVPWPPV